MLASDHAGQVATFSAWEVHAPAGVDDAALDIRGCALKISSAGCRDGLDLKLATGEFAPADCLARFLKVLPVPAISIRPGTSRWARR